jgi:hypothetical protein
MRVVIAGDSVLLREGLARLLADAGHRRVLAPSPPPHPIPRGPPASEPASVPAIHQAQWRPPRRLSERPGRSPR